MKKIICISFCISVICSSLVFATNNVNLQPTEQAVTVSTSSIIVMPKDSDSFFRQQYKAAENRLGNALNNAYKTGDYSKVNDAYQKYYSDNKSIALDIDSKYKDERTRYQVEELQRKIDETTKIIVEKQEDLTKYVMENYPQEIINSLAENIDLYNQKIKMYEQQIENLME